MTTGSVSRAVGDIFETAKSAYVSGCAAEIPDLRDAKSVVGVIGFEPLLGPNSQTHTVAHSRTKALRLRSCYTKRPRRGLTCAIC